VVLADARAGRAVDAIVKAAKTGKIGDGKIFLSTIENAFAFARKKPASKRSDKFSPRLFCGWDSTIKRRSKPEFQ
jgi:hypothetical protein